MKSILAFVLAVLTCQVSYGALSPAEIVQKVQESYRALKTYSAEGATISDMKPPGVRVSARLTNSFSLKLAKSNLFRVEWVQPLPNGTSNDGMTWGDGMGNFLMLSQEGTCRAMRNRDAALGEAGGPTGGASLTVPLLFFDTPGSVLKAVKNFALANDEVLDGDDCYVLSGTINTQRVKVWITKKNFFIKRKQFLIGAMPEPTDEIAKEVLKEMDKEATPAAITETKNKLKEEKALMGKVQGVITETYRNIQADKPVRKEDYIQSIPNGIRFLEN